MAYRKTLYLFIPVLFVLVALTLNSCEKFSGDQKIPAYLSIDSISFSNGNDYEAYGTSSHNITDAWVYIDGEILGTFQLPARFPVLQEGTHKVTILAGIKKDGIASTRVEYPYYNIIEKTVKFVADSTTKLTNLQTTYKPVTKFLWMEDFDSPAITLDTTKRSSIKVKITETLPSGIFEKAHSGMAEMATDSDYFEAITHKVFPISTSSPTYLELNFKTNNVLTVGVFLYSSSTIYDVPIMALFPTNDKWKKIYIDLSTSITAYSGMSTFRVYFAASKDATVDTCRIYLDNCKLLSK
jgi:hypothetical protein